MGEKDGGLYNGTIEYILYLFACLSVIIATGHVYTTNSGIQLTL